MVTVVHRNPPNRIDLIELNEKERPNETNIESVRHRTRDGRMDSIKISDAKIKKPSFKKITKIEIL